LECSIRGITLHLPQNIFFVYVLVTLKYGSFKTLSLSCFSSQNLSFNPDSDQVFTPRPLELTYLAIGMINIIIPPFVKTNNLHNPTSCAS